MEEKERYYHKEYVGDYDILDRNDKNAYYGAILQDEEDAQNLISLLNKQDKETEKLRQENQQLKDRWQKLKDDLMLLYTVGGTSGFYGYNVYKSIFDKMEELEGAKNESPRL